MRVKFANVRYHEIFETRAKVRQQCIKDETSWKSFKESFFCVLQRLPFFAVWCYLIWLYIEDFKEILVNWVCKILQIDSIQSKLFTMLIIGILFAVLSYKSIFYAAKILAPQRTPIEDHINQRNNFYQETKYLEDAAELMNLLQSLSKEELMYLELLIEEDEVALLIKNSELGYIEKRKYKVKNKETIKTLKETGVIDFSFIDDEWDMLKKQYAICNSVEEVIISEE